MERIEFNKPSLVGDEIPYILEAVKEGQISGDGAFGKRCERLLEESLGAHRVFLTPSCTHALEMAAILLDIEPGDEVIMPSFTFVSTANAFVLRGAKPVFVEISPETLNLDAGRVAAAVTDRTRAICPVHYGGVGCDMDALDEIARKHDLVIVEDNAHGLFASYHGRPLGTFGRFATLSFHETKNFTCGEGGALIVNDERDVERAEIIRQKGTDRMKFFRGEVDKYTWCDVGSSFLPSEVQAAFLLAQLERRTEILERRAALHERYAVLLADWAVASGVRLPFVPDDCVQGYHVFHLIMPTPAAREGLIRHLDSRGITAVFHYVPLHDSPMGERIGYARGELPITEDLSARLVRLPLFVGLTDAEQDHVCESVRAFVPDA